MYAELKEVIAGFSNEKLLEHYYDKRDEYTASAIAVMEEEIKWRKISDEERKAYLEGKTQLDNNGADAPRVRTIPREEFIRFDHTFSSIDILLVNSILHDAQVPFYSDNPTSTPTLPTESAASQAFTIHVHRDHIDKAHELIDQHFDKEEGAYRLKYSDAKQRLRAFNFSDIHLSETEQQEEVDVAFSGSEAGVIISYARQLVRSVDAVEKEQDRVVFYYDNLEELVEKLSRTSKANLTKMDLLTVMEVLQIYCDDEQFPQTLNDAITTLLNFFLQ